MTTSCTGNRHVHWTDWTQFLHGYYFKPVPTSYHHFKFSRANAGVVTVKVYATSEEDVNILKKAVTMSSLRGHRPDAVQQTKQRTLPVHYLQSPNPNNKTLCITLYTLYYITPLIWCQCGCNGIFLEIKSIMNLHFSQWFSNDRTFNLCQKKLFFKFPEITPFLHARSHIWNVNKYQSYSKNTVNCSVYWKHHRYAS